MTSVTSFPCGQVVHAAILLNFSRECGSWAGSLHIERMSRNHHEWKLVKILLKSGWKKIQQVRWNHGKHKFSSLRQISKKVWLSFKDFFIAKNIN